MNASTATPASREATFIPFRAASGKEEAIASLLRGAASLVKATEPQTLQWLALRESDSSFGIIDFFADPAGREAHFAGKVAAALKQAAPEAVAGGWDHGVVAKVENSQVLSYTVSVADDSRAKLATRVDIKAKTGMAEELAKELAAAAIIIRGTEPETLLWYAIRIDERRFAIFDVFETEAGRSAHFAGQVAAALKAGADKLVEGGWEAGVVANIRNSRVLSASY